MNKLVFDFQLYIENTLRRPLFSLYFFASTLPTKQARTSGRAGFSIGERVWSIAV